MQGEEPRVGVEWSDPAAVLNQLPYWTNGVAERSTHLWRLELPAGLAAGEHTATVTATDVHGRSFEETLTFTVTD